MIGIEDKTEKAIVTVHSTYVNLSRISYFSRVTII